MDKTGRTKSYLDFKKNNLVLAVPGDIHISWWQKFMAAALILNQKVGVLYYNRLLTKVKSHLIDILITFSCTPRT